MIVEAPTQQQCFDRIMGLHPKGRAWQTHESFQAPDESIFRQFWWAVAGWWATIEGYVVSFTAEFFCTTAAADVDLWTADYEDACGLADYDLCLKVHGASGTPDLSYFQEVATTLGYTATFEWLKGDHTAYPGVYATLLVTVDSASSPSFGFVPVGEFVVGESRLGGVGTDLLKCILEQLVPAHIDLIYVLT